MPAKVSVPHARNRRACGQFGERDVVAGKRIDKRAVHGPAEDRARKPAEDRARKPAEDRKKMRFRDEERQTPEGLSNADAKRWKNWNAS